MAGAIKYITVSEGYVTSLSGYLLDPTDMVSVSGTVLGSHASGEVVSLLMGSGLAITSGSLYHTPRFVGCRLAHSTTQSINSATWTALTFDTENYDTSNFHSAGSGTIIIPPVGLAGTYQFTGQAAFPGLAGNVGLRVAINSGTIVASILQVGSLVAGDPAMNISTTYNLVSGDYAELHVFQDSGSPVNSLASGEYAPRFMATFLGA